MKLQHSSKFKLPKNISISKGVKDDLGCTHCFINEENPIIVEIDQVVLKNGDSSYSIQLVESVFKDHIKPLEDILLQKLHNNSKTLFGKEFPLEKFQKGYNSPLKEELSELVINITEKSKILDQLGNDVKSKIEEYLNLEGKCIIKMSSLRFITTYIYCDWELVYFKQSASYDLESDDEKEKEEEQTDIVVEQEESFF